MEPNAMLAGVREFGLGVVLAIIIATLLFIIIKWTLATTKEILLQAAKERECWQGMIAKLNASIDLHSIQAHAFHEQVNEAHKYQREEHKEMILFLRQLNGH